MTILVATLASLLAAALFAVATAFQHRSAGLVTAADRERASNVAAFMARTLRHPLWIVGTLADVGGFGLHALALRYGPLTLVQPLLVTGVIFALALRQILEHRRPRRNELAWAGALAVGLVLFLTISTPAQGVAKPADPVPTIVLSTLIGVGVLGCFVVGRHASGSMAAAVLGTAAGLAYAATAGLMKEIVGTVSQGVWAVATSWPLYALIVVGIFGLMLNQLAFQAGPLRSSLSAITTVDPIVSLVIGVAVFDEQFRNGPGDVLGEALGLALVITAAVGLTRSDPSPPYPAGGSGKGARDAISASVSAPSEVL
jgi:drug/metabolite transporter (DMT)-like permease